MSPESSSKPPVPPAPPPSSVPASSCLSVPTATPGTGDRSIVRRLSEIATNLALASTDTLDLDLTDEAIKATGAKLLKDYVRDRLFRQGFLPPDEAWFREENNNNNENHFNNLNTVNGLVHVYDADSAALVTRDAGAPLRRLNVSKPSISRSNSFNSNASFKNASCNSSFSGADGEKAGKSGAAASTLPSKRERPAVATLPAQLPIDVVGVHLRRFCLYLERKHSSVYREVSRALNITMSSLSIVDEALTHIADHVLFVDDGDAATHRHDSPRWGKIASLFVLTSAFCIDCVIQGHADFMGDVLSMSTETIFRSEVTSWIRNAGGWSNLVEIATDSRKDQDPWHIVLVLAFGVLLGFVLTLLSSFRLPVHDA